MTKLLPILIFSLLAGGLLAEEFSYDKPKFTCTIPSDFVRSNDFSHPEIGYYEVVNGNEVVYTLGLELYGEQLQPHELDENFEVEGGGVVDTYYVEWQENKLRVAIIRADAGDGSFAFTHLCWVPLKGEALLVGVTSLEQDNPTMRNYLKNTVQSIQGEAAPLTSGINSLLGFAIIFVIGGIVIASKVVAAKNRKKQRARMQNFSGQRQGMPQPPLPHQQAGMPQPPQPGFPQPPQQNQNRPNYPNQQPPR